MNFREGIYQGRLFLFLTFTAFLFAKLFSCSGVQKIDPTSLIVDSGPVMQIPEVCKVEYESPAEIRVGVVDFTNLSKFSPPVSYYWYWWREVEMMLPETVADGVTDELVNIGGAGIYTRTEMEKVFEEHNFQLSGHVDDQTMINFGKLAGLTYIVTGSITNINAVSTTERKETRDVRGRKSTKSVTETRANVELAIRMIDVTTGQVVLSQRVTGRSREDGSGRGPAVSAIKKASSRALKDIRPEFSKRFSINGYILQTRISPDGKNRFALINFGNAQGMREGQKLNIFTFQEIKDVFTGESICDKVKLPVEGVVTNQIQQNTAWISLRGDDSQVSRVQPGALVERAAFERPGIFDIRPEITRN